jgi:hypothetical protein
MTDKETTAEMQDLTQKLAKASSQVYTMPGGYSVAWPVNYTGSTPWSPSDIDKLEFTKHKNWKNVVTDCRYYYKRDPFASTVVNKIIDIAINDIVVHSGEARDSIIKIVEGIRTPLLLFLRNAALEYLTTGLLVPEITFDSVNKADLHALGIKRFKNLILPVDMWIRDSSTIVIKDPLIGGRKSYFMELPAELIYFILNKGKYQDGSEDPELYKEIAEEYPEIIKAVTDGETKILLENPFVIQSRTLSNEAYPIPFLYPALESLKHKRNIKRMDYSLASRVITAIQLIKMGSDEFPLTEDNEDQLEDLKQEMRWRENISDKNVERIFQLFANHTVEIEWIFPDVKILLDDTKYKSVNQDIGVALGFPRILVTGETERTQTSDPEIATISPLNTMERIREAIFPIVERIIDTIVVENKLGGQPELAWQPVNLMAMSDFVSGIQELYVSGNLSRESFAKVFGFDLFEELLKRAEENDMLKELKLEEFAPVPHSNQPEGGGQTRKPAPKKPAPKSKKNA